MAWSIDTLATPMPQPLLLGPGICSLCLDVLAIRKYLGGSEKPSWDRKVDFPVTGEHFLDNQQMLTRHLGLVSHLNLDPLCSGWFLRETAARTSCPKLARASSSPSSNSIASLFRGTCSQRSC